MILARGLRPSSVTFSCDARTTALAPSLRLLALAAVTVPVLMKTGRREGTLAGKIFLYSSSSMTMVSPLRASVMVTGAISPLKAPAAQATAALRYDSRANSSWCSRVISCLRAVSSALRRAEKGQRVPIYVFAGSNCDVLTSVPWQSRCRHRGVRP